MSKIMIRNGFVVDGTGNPSFRADLTIEDGKITKIGRELIQVDRTIDATGQVVCPGFVDIHAHSDYTLLADPKAESVIRQGVTTEVIGNCGMSAAPLTGSAEKQAMDTMKGYGLHLDWTSFEGYLTHLAKGGTAINVASFVGHGIVREAVIGYDAREPTPRELADMKAMVAEAMEQGAWGLSSMPQFAPGCYADTDEIVELVRVAGRYGGIYATHIRTWNYQGLREAVEVGERSGVPVEVNHYCSSVDKEVEVGFQILEEARSRGVDVTFDLYPYLAGSGGLSQGIPDWAFEGGVKKLLENLRNHETRKRIKEEWAIKLNELYRGDPWNKDYRKQAEWGLMISSAKGSQLIEGRFIADIADEWGTDPYEAAIEILIQTEGEARMVGFHIREWNVQTAMNHPLSMFCTDGWALAPQGVLASGKPHPRSYGTYPRILARYVRKKGVLKLEDAIRKMTSLPAQKVGLLGRGLIREGMYADIIVFDPKTVEDRATYMSPCQYPVGINYVLVNGEIVIEEGEHTGILPGKVLRGPGHAEKER